MILACNHISKAFVEKDVLTDATFHIEEHEKAAIVGINGAGKTTLLKIIIGAMTPDSGEVVLAKDKTLGYLAQQQEVMGNRTVYEEMREVKRELLDLEARIRGLEQEMKHAKGEQLAGLMEAYTKANHRFEQENGYALESEVTGILKGLGFGEEDFAKEVSCLSGGQKTRLALGKLLLSKPDVILLDEPTNHLDMESIRWLENFLSNYSGSVIIVAHDRYFLDKIVTKVIEIDNTRVRTYMGNYTAYSQKKEQILEAMMKAYENQQREIKHQEAVISKLKSFNREKSIKRAESREKMLAKIEVLEKSDTADNNAGMRVSLEPRVLSGNDVLTVRNLAKGFGEGENRQELFSGVDLDVKRGERVAVIGNNGTGKTTLLKIINGGLAADEGEVKLGAKVSVGYYDQEHQVLHMEKTLFQEMSDAYPTLTNTQIRNVLAAFLFTGDDVFKRIGDLSGGERGRVSLAKLMLSESNFLILDEPTNHLDMISKQILEQALNRYTGTVLYVSHDRYFINQTATSILELEKGGFTLYKGNYDYYMEKKQQLLEESRQKGDSGSSEGTLTGHSGGDSGALDWKQQKEQQARLRKQKNDLAKTEAEIEKLETESTLLDEQLTDEAICSNSARLMEIHQQKSEIERRLEELYARWEALSIESDI